MQALNHLLKNPYCFHGIQYFYNIIVVEEVELELEVKHKYSSFRVLRLKPVKTAVHAPLPKTIGVEACSRLQS